MVEARPQLPRINLAAWNSTISQTKIRLKHISPGPPNTQVWYGSDDLNGKLHPPLRSATLKIDSYGGEFLLRCLTYISVRKMCALSERILLLPIYLSDLTATCPSSHIETIIHVGCVHLGFDYRLRCWSRLRWIAFSVRQTWSKCTINCVRQNEWPLPDFAAIGPEHSGARWLFMVDSLKQG